MGPHIFCVIGSRGCCAVFVVPGISGQSKTIHARIWGHCELAISLQTLSTKHIPKMVVLYRGSVHIGVRIKRTAGDSTICILSGSWRRCGIGTGGTSNCIISWGSGRTLKCTPRGSPKDHSLCFLELLGYSPSYYFWSYLLVIPLQTSHQIVISTFTL